MTTEQYRKAIQKLGLKVTTAGPALGLSPRQAQRIAGGHSKVPEPVAKLIRLCIKHKVDPRE